MRICILVPLIYSIRLILLISADLEFVDTKLGISTFVFQQNDCLIFCEMKCRNLIMTVCKRARRNLKLQLYLVWPGDRKNECIMNFQDDEWPGTSGREVTIAEEY